jgi:hypothetical protein
MKDLVIFGGFAHIAQEVAIALLPLVVILLMSQFFIRMPWDEIRNILVGILLSFLGLSLFLQGVNVGFMPTGAAIGEYLGKLDHNWIVIPIGLILGFVTVIAEPAVRVLTYEVENVSSGFISQKIMLYALSIGVAVSVGLAMARIVYGIPLMYILIPGYTIALIMIRYTSSTFVSVAFDSGGVATGPMTVTFVLAMAVGVATGIEGRDPLLDGFGLISLVALAPILSVLSLGVLLGGKTLDVEEGNALDNENSERPSINSNNR